MSSTDALDPAYAITGSGLTKRYGHQPAVDQVDLRIPAGVVAGFVGPNGAGKSTTIRTLLGLIRPPRAPPTCWESRPGIPSVTCRGPVP